MTRGTESSSRFRVTSFSGNTSTTDFQGPRLIAPRSIRYASTRRPICSISKRARLRNAKLRSRMRRFSILSQLRSGTIPPAGLYETIPKAENVSSGKNGERMRLDLRGRCGGGDRRFLPYRAIVLMPMVLLTTVSCSTLSIDLAECDLSSGLVTEEQVLPPRPKIRREQANTSATPKATPVRASNASGQPGSGDAPKKASTPPRRDGQEVQKERVLFNEFLEWRKSQGGGDVL
jgi:hypothetical protein